MAKEKQPKETDAVKQKLESYAVLQRKIDNQIERLENLNATMCSPSTSNITGLPNGSFNGTSRIERHIAIKNELEEKIRCMIKEEQQLRIEIEQLVDQLKNPDEQTVIEMRYLDRTNWWTVCAALYSTEPEYEEKADKYLKRTFKLHGSALQALARLNIEESDNS